MTDELRPRLCYLTKGRRGYGFHLHGECRRGAQFIRRVEAGSPAELAGLRSGDRVVEVNGENVEHRSHGQVVQKIMEVENRTRLLVVNQETDDFLRRHFLPCTEDLAVEMSCFPSGRRSRPASALSSSHSGLLVWSLRSSTPCSRARESPTSRESDTLGSCDSAPQSPLGSDTVGSCDSAPQLPQGSDTLGSCDSAPQSPLGSDTLRSCDSALQLLRQCNTLGSCDSAPQTPLGSDTLGSCESCPSSPSRSTFRSPFRSCDSTPLSSRDSTHPSLQESWSYSESNRLGSRDASTRSRPHTYFSSSSCDSNPPSPPYDVITFPLRFNKTPTKHVITHGNQETLGSEVATVMRDLRPRLCVVASDGQSFGFNLHCEKRREGQYIRSVDPDSPAERAGLLPGDRLIQVNGRRIEGMRHSEVVTLIRGSGHETRLLVVDPETDGLFKKLDITPTTAHLKEDCVDGPILESPKSPTCSNGSPRSRTHWSSSSRCTLPETGIDTKLFHGGPNEDDGLHLSPTAAEARQKVRSTKAKKAAPLMTWRKKYEVFSNF